VCGVTARQLDYWVELGLIRPTLLPGPVRSHRRYSFRDLVTVRAIAALRKAGVQLREIRAIAHQLAQEDLDLADTWLVTDGSAVLRLREEDVLETLGRRPGQLAFSVIVMSSLTADTSDALGRVLKGSRVEPSSATEQPPEEPGEAPRQDRHIG
jgi:DNA-binding transcriptional MerR regulator